MRLRAAAPEENFACEQMQEGSVSTAALPLFFCSAWAQASRTKEVKVALRRHEKLYLLRTLNFAIASASVRYNCSSSSSRSSHHTTFTLMKLRTDVIDCAISVTMVSSNAKMALRAAAPASLSSPSSTDDGICPAATASSSRTRGSTSRLTLPRVESPISRPSFAHTEQRRKQKPNARINERIQSVEAHNQTRQRRLRRDDTLRLC